MSDTVRIYGSPADLSDGSDLVREAEEITPLRNPLPAEQPNPSMSREDAAAALRALALEDGWTALFDPTDESTITMDGTNIGEIRDSLGNLPPLVRHTGVVELLPNPLGSLRGISGQLHMADVSSGLLAPVIPRAEYSFLGVSRDARTPAGSVAFLSAPGESDGILLTNVQPNGNFTQSTVGDAGSVTRSSPLEFSSVSGDPRIFDISCSGVAYNGALPIRFDEYDEVAFNRPLQNFRGNYFSFSGGPLLVSDGPISQDARERAGRLLSQLMGTPRSIPDPEGHFSDGGYCVSNQAGVPVAWHRPDRPVQIASLAKVWTCALAYQILSGETGFDLDSPIVMVPEYRPASGTKAPRVYPGDSMTLRDAFHGSLLVSHNQITDAIATEAGKVLNPSDPIGAFIQHMNDEAVSRGWAEAVFETPAGYDCYMSPRHYNELLRWVNINTPFITSVMSQREWTYLLVRGNPSDPEETFTEGTWRNLVTNDSEGVSLPELIAGKGGLISSPRQIRTIATIWENPSTGYPYYATVLDTGSVYAHRYRFTRNLWNAVETLNGPVPDWFSRSGSVIEWGYGSGIVPNRVVAFRKPGDVGDIILSPFDPAMQGPLYLEPGDTVSFSATFRVPSGTTLSEGARASITARIQGGTWVSGGRDSTSSPPSFPGDWTTQTVNATVSSGGFLDVFARLSSSRWNDSLQVRNASLTVNVTERYEFYFDLPLRGYSVEEHGQSMDAADPRGAVGGFTAETVLPDRETAIGRFGVGWLKGRSILIRTPAGEMTGRIRSPRLVDGSLLSLVSTTALQELVAQRVIGEPFSGDLADLLLTYFGRAPGLPRRVDIHPSFNGVPVASPQWEGDAWNYLKLLASAYGLYIYLRGDEIVVDPVPSSSELTAPGISITEELEDGPAARSVEVVKYSGRVVSEEMVYPPGGVSSGTEILAVDAGQTVEVETPVGVSLTDVIQPLAVDSVQLDQVGGSVYSVVDDNGDAVPAQVWTQGGGSVSVSVGNRGDTLLITITAPSGLSRRDGEPVASFSLASQRVTTHRQFPTLRVLGSGVDLSTQVLRVPTGNREALTEVGAVIDNPFITTWSQALTLGARAAVKYGGFRPRGEVSAPREGFTDGVNRVLRGDSYDFRTLSASHTPGGSSFEVEYATTHQTYGDLFRGPFVTQSYGTVQDEMSSPHRFTYRDDLLLGKKRP